MPGEGVARRSSRSFVAEAPHVSSVTMRIGRYLDDGSLLLRLAREALITTILLCMDKTGKLLAPLHIVRGRKEEPKYQRDTP